MRNNHVLSLKPKGLKETITLVVVFLGVLLISAFAVYFLASKSAEQRREAVATTQMDNTRPEGAPAEVRPSPRDGSPGIFGQVFSPSPQGSPIARAETWAQILGTLSLRLVLAAILGAVLAYRPRRRVHGLKANPYVAQT